MCATTIISNTLRNTLRMEWSSRPRSKSWGSESKFYLQGHTVESGGANMHTCVCHVCHARRFHALLWELIVYTSKKCAYSVKHKSANFFSVKIQKLKILSFSALLVFVQLLISASVPWNLYRKGHDYVSITLYLQNRQWTIFTNCYYQISKEQNHPFLISYNSGKKNFIILSII